MTDKPGRQQLPLLPLRDVVVFPEMVVPLFVGREKSIQAIEAAIKNQKQLMLCTQQDAQIAEPTPDDIYRVGTLAQIHQVVRMPDGMLKLLVEGKSRMRIVRFVDEESVFDVHAESIDVSSAEVSVKVERIRQRALEAFEKLTQISKKITKETAAGVSATRDPSQMADLIAATLDISLADRQFLLEVADPALRLEELLRVLEDRIEAAEIEQKIKERTKEQMERNQREYYLNEQMKAIRSELDEQDGAGSELDELAEKIAAKEFPEHARERAEQEFKKLKQMPPTSAEASVVRNYIDWLLSVPWQDEQALSIDLKRVQQVLDEDHFGLDKVKERIIEFLAVRSLTASLRGPKLCLVGPPGVGKTSLAKSIARALDLNFVRQSLGGVRDEAEIRGHRRTYIGAMPGRIVQGLKKAGSSNPVFLLDEIDKMSSDYRGDPGSALLEVLDPEQNDTFMDHYLDLELDLSKVFFVSTANTLHTIHRPLQDRLEVIEIGSYTEDEKVEITLRHLVPKQLERNGLQDFNIAFQKPAVRKLIRNYTREAGVRNLERRVEAVLRKIAVRVAAGELESTETVKVTPKSVREALGPEMFRDPAEAQRNQVGVTQGLAWTEVGGQMLQTEVAVLPGRGKLEITGKLGEVMHESARAAMSYVRGRAEQLAVDPLFYKNVDLHIHVPEGAVPKDGPSAGITMATALASALTGLPVRGDIAMTGEITLSGQVLPIGGLKEKLLAAHRAGIQTVLIPRDCKKDLEEVPEVVREAIEIRLVAEMDDVLEIALISGSSDGVFHYLQERGARHPLPMYGGDDVGTGVGSTLPS